MSYPHDFQKGHLLPDGAEDLILDGQQFRLPIVARALSSHRPGLRQASAVSGHQTAKKRLQNLNMWNL